MDSRKNIQTTEIQNDFVIFSRKRKQIQKGNYRNGYPRTRLFTQINIKKKKEKKNKVREKEFISS